MPRESNWMPSSALNATAVIVPDLLDRCPSSLTTTQITLAQYARPALEWPFLLLCQ